MLNKFKPDFSKVGSLMKSFSQPAARPMPRTVQHLKELYSKSSDKLLEGGRGMILKKSHVRFIAFREYALSTNNEPGEPPVINVKVDADLNPHVLRIDGGKLHANVQVDGILRYQHATLEIEDFLEYVRIGVFVFVDFEK